MELINFCFRMFLAWWLGMEWNGNFEASASVQTLKLNMTCITSYRSFLSISLEKLRILYGLAKNIIVLYLQFFNVQLNYILFKISASGLILKYIFLNILTIFTNFGLDMLIKHILIKKKECSSNTPTSSRMTLHSSSLSLLSICPIQFHLPRLNW